MNMVSKNDIIIILISIAIPVFLLIVSLYCYYGDLCERRTPQDEENNLHRAQTSVNPNISFPGPGQNFEYWVQLIPRVRNEQMIRSNNTFMGLDQPTIDSYPTSPFGGRICEDNFDATCAICLEKYFPNDVVKRLPCTHPFHVECIDPWLRTKAQCPLCKETLLVLGTCTS